MLLKKMHNTVYREFLLYIQFVLLQLLNYLNNQLLIRKSPITFGLKP